MAKDSKEDIKKRLESMLDLEINKIEEDEEEIRVNVDEDKIGRAIGFRGFTVRAAEEALGKKVEIVKE
ncbi:MAG: transcription elongation factor NusA [Candidatus Aenigmatarchaeota archaeon]